MRIALLINNDILSKEYSYGVSCTFISTLISSNQIVDTKNNIDTLNHIPEESTTYNILPSSEFKLPKTHSIFHY